MADITRFKNKTLSAIDDGMVEQKPRPYLGMSKIGHSCNRYLWYSFRWCFPQSHTKRMKRLLNRGHREELVFRYELEKIGIKVWGDQDEVIIAHGHCKGHRDGCCLGVLEAPKTEHLLEEKTMSDKNFKDILKKGLKASKLIYYAQCQIYMRKFKLTRTLFLAVNKNTDAWFIRRVKLDKGFADDLQRKAETIILSETPPEKTFKSTWYECKFCDARAICHGNNPVLVNCRTCSSCDLLPDGLWECSRHGIPLATGQQRIGCKYYKAMI